MRKSHEDYDGHKEDIVKSYLDKGINKKSVDKFINYYSSLYDKKRRCYFPVKLAWHLFDIRSWVIKENQHYWAAFIGRVGGEGKSTLCKNVSFFLDSTFGPERVSLNYDSFISEIYKTMIDNDFPAVVLDEPENKTHQFSEKGRKLKDILGKIRQVNLFVGVCVNNLNDIPSFILDRLAGIFYLTSDHRFTYWNVMKDRPKFTIINEIKKGFKREGHSVFVRKEIKKRAFIKSQCFSKYLPFNDKEYETKKRKDLQNDIGKYLTRDIKKPKIWDRDKNICAAYKKGDVTRGSLSKSYNLTTRTIDLILEKNEITKYKV